MNPTRAFLLLLTLSACGNFSNDDLVFLSAIPRPSEVELTVEPTTTEQDGALVGQAAEYYLVAYQSATDINASVQGILAFVDALGQGYPPTSRTDDSRTWGPVKDLDGKGATLQLEIRRERGDDSTRFVFCLHIVRDADFDADELACDNNGKSLPAVLEGSFTPHNSEATSRDALGSIRLDFEAAHAAGVGKPRDRGLIELTYDFVGGGVAKSVHVETSVPELESQPEKRAIYDYEKADDGRVDFYLEFDEDVFGGGFGGFGTDLQETLSIDAFWYDDAPGRAEVNIAGGDVAEDEHVTATECWNATQRRTYYNLDVSEFPEWNSTEGELVLCP